MSLDNREAMAYLLFRRFKCSRAAALAAVDELGAVFPGVRKVATGRWRSHGPLKPAPAPAPAEPGEGER